MLRRKTPALVITFEATTQAMAMERFCGQEGLPGRLIPVPREITAGCGLAWKAPPEAEETLLPRLEAAGLQWSQRYILEL